MLLRVSRQVAIIDKKGIEQVIADLRAKASTSNGSSRPCAEKIRLIPRPARSLLHNDEESPAASREDGVMKYDPVVRKHVSYKETKIKYAR